MLSKVFKGKGYLRACSQPLLHRLEEVRNTPPSQSQQHEDNQPPIEEPTRVKKEDYLWFQSDIFDEHEHSWFDLRNWAEYPAPLVHSMP